MSAQKDQRMCYYPAGNEGPGNVPCTDDDVTHCCGPGNICLSNGYCLDVSQPYLIARGACTSKTWASGCPTHCQDTDTKIGSSIVNLRFMNGKATYCCGTPVSNGSKVVCRDGKDDFELEDSVMIPGRAGLANVTTLDAPTSSSGGASSSCPTSSSSSVSAGDSGNHNVAIGAGVGVPLGMIALGALAWAFLERKRANRLSKTIASTPATTILPPGFIRTPEGIRSKNSGPMELESGSNGPVELAAKERGEAE
ncbi:hypothetical protein N7492_000435 [Penicillium capsulatum]|uniref:Mid2 domain-containing protein n=1 Tax=Penicillium capsulatum TaxID=69766 RepID=A0A9W9IPJ7_9EURO|nr:hypothetical protein N7492_000435 [Penicillium capsulatum]